MKRISWTRGGAGIEVVLAAAIFIFVILPVFSAVIERYILLNKVQIIKDAVDITNIAVYNSINAGSLGRQEVRFDFAEAEAIYRELLCKNLKLTPDLKPAAGSVAEGPVVLESLEFYQDNLPALCPLGCEIKRPAVHSCLSVPVKPSLYRQLILSAAGKSQIELKIHVDSDIPINN